MDGNHGSAYFDESGQSVVIESLRVEDKDIVREAQRWTTGERGAIVDDPAALASADVTAFANEALLLGARAMTATGQTVEARALERMVADVGERTTEASLRVAEVTARAAKDASDVVARATGDARKAISDAEAATRKELTTAVNTAKQQLLDETRRLFGGESPELLERLQPVLLRFGTELEAHVRSGTTQLLDRAAKQLDPTDPTSPMARHAATLAEQQNQLTERIEKHNAAIAAKVDELATAIKVQAARATLAKVTPIKGGTFEAQLHALMSGIAAGLGDEYEDTTAKAGAVPRCKKGDGVLSVSGQPTKVVVEMSDSLRAGWAEYLDEAERNRCAAASLGIVRTIEQNAGQTIRVLGQRRVVITFDPGADDPELLRTVLQLLRTVAIAASTRNGDAEIATAEERIAEAIVQIEKVDAIKTTAGTIAKNASRIETQCTAISTTIRRLLDQALVALAGTDAGSVGPNEPAGQMPGAA